MIERPLLPDAEARSRIERDLDTILLVEAGAGSGKTERLVARYLALLSTGWATAETLAAITFTRKAAEQMRQRVAAALAEAIAGAPAGEARARLERAGRDLPRAFIGTIHSFCAHLLRSAPQAAGVDPAFAEMDESEALADAEHFFYQEMERLHQAGDPALAAWLGEGLSFSPLQDAFLELLPYPEIEIPAGAEPPPDHGAFREALARFLARLEPLLPPGEAAEGDDEWLAKVRSAKRRLALGLLDSLPLLIDCAEKLSAPVAITKKRWPSAPAAEEAKAAAEAFGEKGAQPFLRSLRRHRYGRVLALVLPALERYRLRRRQEGRLNYQDLLWETALLLRERPLVRAALQRQYRALLVDEFQDVDPLQAEIVFYLASQNPNEKDWRRLTLRPGALFAVGDPKQSIYRFRRADIAIYEQARRLVAEQGALLSLTSTFRAQPALAHFVNAAFAGAFPPVASATQAAFAPLAAVSPPRQGGLCGVRQLSLPAEAGKAGAGIAAAEAAAVATWIAAALRSGVYEPRDFLLLTHRRKFLTTYAAALEKEGVPVVVGGLGEGELPDDLAARLALLRFLADPQRPAALLAVLRGRLFGFSDDELYQAARRNGPLRFADPWFDGPAGTGVGEAFLTLRRWWRLSREWPLSAALAQIIREAGLDEPEPSWLRALLRRGRAASAAGVDFPTWAETAEAELRRDEEEENGAAAVRLMNLHRAKGLEARVVFLLAPVREREQPPARHIRRQENRQEGYFLLTARHGDYHRRAVAEPPDWERWQAAEEEFQRAEQTRLLYVAATRARELLVIGRRAGKAQASPWEFFHPFLDQVEALPARPAAAAVASVPAVAETARSFSAPPDLRPLLSPTYQRRLASALVSGETPSPAAAAPARGKIFGRVVHRALQAAVQGIAGEDLVLFCRNALAAEGRDPQAAREVLARLQPFFDSPLWPRLQQARRCWVEVPMALREEEAGRPLLSYGVADLLFLESDGWVLVDYKSDAVGQADLAPWVAHYRRQLETYAQIFSARGSEPIKEKILFFLQPGRYVSI